MSFLKDNIFFLPRGYTPPFHSLVAWTPTISTEVRKILYEIVKDQKVVITRIKSMVNYSKALCGKGNIRRKNSEGKEVFKVVYNLDKYRQTRNANESIIYGEWVSIARKNQGMTQGELGDRIGYSQSIVSRMETGKLDIWPEDAASIAVALNNSVLLKRYCQQCPVCKTMKDMDQLKPRPAA